MGRKAKQRREPKPVKVVARLVGKTILEARWTGQEGEGFDDLELTFTDGTVETIQYSCMGGVHLGDK